MQCLWLIIQKLCYICHSMLHQNINPMLRIAIIEDENAAFQLLSSIINEFCSDVSICGHAVDVNSGLALLSDQNPDLVFVDVQLGSETIFELLDQVEYRKFKIIFTTAFTNHAIQAFKYEAVDYLLKPYSPKDVIKVIERVKIDILSNPWRLMSHAKTNQRLTVNSHDGISFIEPKDILYCSADGSYCKIIIENERNLVVSKTLSEIEEQLNPDQFVRVHASFLINMDHVKRFIKEDGGYILMSNGIHIPVSRRKKQEFLERVK